MMHNDLNEPLEPLDLDDDPRLRTNVDVQTKRWVLAPVVVVVILVGVAVLGSRGGNSEEAGADGSGGDGAATTSTTRVATGPRTTPIVELATEVDVSDLPFAGALYTVGNPIQTQFDAGTLVRIDLSTGEIKRGPSDVGVVSAFTRHGDRVLVSTADSVIVIDDALDTVAVLEGQYLASRPGEIWTTRVATGTAFVSDLIRYDDNGDVKATIPAELGFVVADYLDGVLHLSSGLGMWTIDDDDQVRSIEFSRGISTQLFGPEVSSQCESSALRCVQIAVYQGQEIILPGLATVPALVQASWSGRFLMSFAGGSGTAVIDLEHPERPLPMTVTFSDSFAVGADMIARRDGIMMVITDLETGSEWRFELPNDVAKYRNKATLLVVDPG